MREDLDKIIRLDGGDNWWKPELFEEKTKDKLPKELEVIAPPPNSDANYNCFVYALGLSDDKEIVSDSEGFIYSDFIKRLIELGELQETSTPEEGDYIVYRDSANYPDLITHMGVVTSDSKIVSKWAWGPLLKHDKMSVPASYGSDISYLSKISEDKARELYEKYKKFNTKD